MPSLSERIAQCALDKFRSLPPKCKPRVSSDDKREWTILSAVVICKGLEQKEVTCISLGTGTKCLSSKMLPKCHGSILHDCHAEIIALRAFNYWVLTEIRNILNDALYQSEYIHRNSGTETDIWANATDISRPFAFAVDVSIHLFTTEAPCGDASMELLISSKSPEDAIPWARRSDEFNAAPNLLGRGHFSVLGAVRRKPARADAEQSLSKSCTDKLAVKQFTSLLSFPADLFLGRSTNAFLESMVIYHHQFHPLGYQRAFGRGGRLSSIPAHNAQFFKIQTLPFEFERFTFEKSIRPPDGQPIEQKASNISAVWILGQNTQGTSDVIEVLISGVKQGYKLLDEREGKESVLCRKQMWLLGRDVCGSVCQNSNSSALPNSQALSRICDGIAIALQSPSYSIAKQSAARRDKSTFRLSVVAQMGNWVRNSGDDEWSLN